MWCRSDGEFTEQFGVDGDGGGAVGGGWRAHQLAHQEVPAALADVGQAVDERMLGPGHDEQLEVLVGGDEPVGQPQRVVRVDLVVHLAVDEQQLAGQRDRDVLLATELRAPWPRQGLVPRPALGGKARRGAGPRAGAGVQGRLDAARPHVPRMLLASVEPGGPPLPAAGARYGGLAEISGQRNDLQAAPAGWLRDDFAARWRPRGVTRPAPGTSPRSSGIPALPDGG